LTRSFGGAERLCVETIDALKEAGHYVDLVVNERTDRRLLKQRYGADLKANKEVVVFPFISLPTIYSNMVNWLLRDIIFVPYIKGRYDLTVNTGPFLPISFDDLVYIQDYPGKLCLHGKYRSNLWRAYSSFYAILANLIVGIFSKLKQMPVLVTNSRFNGQAVENSLNRKALILYPPVHVTNYLSLSKLKCRANIVLTISRIDESKGLDFIPNIAAKVDDAKFVIIGSVCSKSCLQGLQRTITKAGLEKRVIIIPNASEEVKKACLAKAKIYLSLSRYEAFGISVIEGMASGLVPLVYKNGAPWVDILREEPGLYGYGYADACSCANLINVIIHNDHLRTEITQRSMEQSLQFNNQIYRKNIVTLVEQLLKLKSSH